MKNPQEKTSNSRKTSKHPYVTGLLRMLGLNHCPGCYLNSRFILALLIAALFVVLFHDFISPYFSGFIFNWTVLLSIIIWQPVIEELLFRGVIQGQFAKQKWGKRSWQGISNANLVTSVLFVAAHMIYSPPLAALSVMAPSLVFGYFRDYSNSVIPSIILHSAYNAMVFMGLMLNGNLSYPSL